MAHERTKRLVVGTNTENVPDNFQTHSCHKAKHSTLETKHFVKERWDPLLIMTIWVMSKRCWTRRTWTSEFHDYQILLWSMRKVPAFDNSIQKIETHPNRHALQQDPRQNQACNPFSPKSKQMTQEAGNNELFELLETDPKTQCTTMHCNTGT